MNPAHLVIKINKYIMEHDTLIPHKTWIVAYIDADSDGVRKTAISGQYTKEEVIDFFGLNNSDVYWYDVYEFIEKEEEEEYENG